MLPSIVAALCVGFGLAESAAERSTKKAALRTVLALPLGIVFGFFFDVFANMVYGVGISIAVSLGAHDNHNPIIWIARGIGWVVFGVAGGLVFTASSGSPRRRRSTGSGWNAGRRHRWRDLRSDPSIAVNGAALSRLAGFALFGLATGAAMGVVESALKDRWLYVSAGPLAGKQFILYKQITKIGSSQQCDIYLFKDVKYSAEHAIIETRGSKVQIRGSGPIYVTGQPVQTRVLQDGDFIQIGRYGFRYKEKQKSWSDAICPYCRARSTQKPIRSSCAKDAKLHTLRLLPGKWRMHSIRVQVRAS